MSYYAIMDEVTEKLDRIGFRQYGMTFPRRGCPLHVLPTACGRQRVSTPDYDWHGLRRGSEGFVVFQYTLGGEGRLEYEGSSYVLAEGTAMLVMIPHDHRYFFPGNVDEWRFVYLCLTGREALRLSRYIITERGPVFKLSSDSKPIQEIVRFLEMSADDDIQQCPHSSSATGYSFLMSLLEDVLPGTGKNEVPPAIMRAVEYCRCHFAEPVTVDQLAEVAGYSRYHFSRQFKLYLGLTPVEYITDLRLQKAVRLVRETLLPLKQVAPQCGFPDGNYLCRVFHRVYGITPGEFRRSGMYI